MKFADEFISSLNYKAFIIYFDFLMPSCTAKSISFLYIFSYNSYKGTIYVDNTVYKTYMLYDEKGQNHYMTCFHVHLLFTPYRIGKFLNI